MQNHNIELYDLLKRQPIENYLGFFQNEDNLSGLSESSKSRLKAIASFLKGYQGGFSKWDQLLAYFDNELNLAKANGEKQFNILLNILNNFGKQIFTDESDNIQLLLTDAFVKSIINRQLKMFPKHLHLARYLYPIIAYSARNFSKEEPLQKSINEVAIAIIQEEDPLIIAKLIGNLTFNLSHHKIGQHLENAYLHMQRLLTFSQRISIIKFNLSQKAKRLEIKLVERLRRYSPSQTDQHFTELAKSHWDATTNIPFDENQCETHWTNLISNYSQQINDTNLNKLYRIACIKHVDLLIKHIIIPYPDFNFIKSIAIFKNLNVYSTQRAALATKLKHCFNKQTNENKIAFLECLIIFNQQINKIDPFLTKALVGLVNQGVTKEQAERLKIVAARHNEIVQSRRKTRWGRFISWLQNETQQIIEPASIIYQQGDNNLSILASLEEEQSGNGLSAEKQRCEDLSHEKFQNDMNNVLAAISIQINNVIDEKAAEYMQVSKEKFDDMQLDEKIKALRKNQKNLKRELRKRFDDLNSLLKPYEEAQEQIKQQKQLLEDPDQGKVYTGLLSKLTECFLGAKAVASGRVKLEKTTKGKVGRIIGVVGAMLPIPLFNKLVAVIGVCIAEHDKHAKDRENRSIAQITLTCSAAEQLAELTARRVAIFYKDEISLLADDEQGQGRFIKDIYQKVIALIIGERLEIVSYDPIKTAENLFNILRQPLPKTGIINEVLAYFGWEQRPLKLKTEEFSVSTEQILCNNKLLQLHKISQADNVARQKNFKKETDIIGIIRNLDNKVDTMAKSKRVEDKQRSSEVERIYLENERLRLEVEKLRLEIGMLKKQTSYPQILSSLSTHKSDQAMPKSHHCQELPKTMPVFAKQPTQPPVNVTEYSNHLYSLQMVSSS